MTNLLEQMIAISDSRNMEAPDGLTYGFRSVRPDFTSKHGYRWSFPGNWSEASGPFRESNLAGCPDFSGDGICIANTWQGMASGSIPAHLILLVGYHETDVLGHEENESKIRVKRAFVRDLIDGTALLITSGTGANLTRANLTRANLTGANLTRANLTRANLTRATNKDKAYGLGD